MDLMPIPDGPIDPDGRLRVGAYRGALDEVRWGYPTGWLDGQVKRALGRKRWFSAGVFARDRVIVVRILDQGLVGSGLVWVADLRTGKTELEHRFFGVPLANLAVGPVAGRGAHAYITLPTSRLFLRRDESASAWTIECQLPGHALSLSLDTRSAPPPMTTIGALRPGSEAPEPTRGILLARHVGLEARGTVRFRSEVQSIGDEALGFLEYGNGFFVAPAGNVSERPRSVAAGAVGPVEHGPEVPAETGAGASDPITSHAFPSPIGRGKRTATPGDDGAPDERHDEREVAWSSALVSGVTARGHERSTAETPALRSQPWALASDLGAFSASGESAIWSRGEVHPVGPVVLRGDPDTKQPWTIASAGGALDLSFQPRCACIEETRAPALVGRLGRLRSAANAVAMRIALVAGHFEGTIAGPDGPVTVNAVGLCEARAFGL